MAFDLLFTPEAEAALDLLRSDGHLEKKLRKVQRALGRLQQDPRYPGLSSHKYSSLSGVNGEEVWDSYVENNTPSAWRIYWHYGPGRNVITVFAITPHPKD
ncbi:hypothetical protein [Specibacter cremeus]|uniref:hypothetical protein n=1 Tax=Specibacter cremeus TaxID=1629051 RepID=UPI000F779629|nr:hypothetical protein [Specibacter cremeus]